MTQASSIIAIVPAAGVGRRMGTERPKQYLQINEATVLEHTVYKLLSHPNIAKVVIVVGKNDPYFSHLSLAQDDRVAAVIGGAAEYGDSARATVEGQDTADGNGSERSATCRRNCVISRRRRTAYDQRAALCIDLDVITVGI